MPLHGTALCIHPAWLPADGLHSRPPFGRDASLKENDLSFGCFKHFCSTFDPTRIFAFSHPPPKSPLYFFFLVFALWPSGFNKGNPWGHECRSSQWIMNNSAIIALLKTGISSPLIVSLSYQWLLIDPSPTCDWIFTFLDLASCRSCISNFSCYDFMHASHAMAFHTHKTKIHGPLPYCPTHISSALSSTAFWGVLRGSHV